MSGFSPLRPEDASRSRVRFQGVPLTSALALLPVGASEQEWLQARRRDGDRWRIGASELAAVLGISPNKSPFSLWWSKQDGWAHAERTVQQDLGHRLEDLIGELWAERHPEAMLCRPGYALFGHPDPLEDWLVCTPDFLAVRDVIEECSHGADCTVHVAAGIHDFDAAKAVVIEPVECKSDDGGKGWGKPGTDEVPEQYRVQVYVQCEVLGARRGHLMRLAGKRPTEYVLPYDDAAKAKMARWLQEGRRFVWSLINDEPPPLDGHEATTQALQQIHAVYTEDKRVVLDPELIREFRGVEDMYATIKTAREDVRNRIRDALRDAQIGTDAGGAGVVRRNMYKRSGYEVGPSMVDELRRMS